MEELFTDPELLEEVLAYKNKYFPNKPTTPLLKPTELNGENEDSEVRKSVAKMKMFNELDKMMANPVTSLASAMVTANSPITVNLKNNNLLTEEISVEGGEHDMTKMMRNMTDGEINNPLATLTDQQKTPE